MRRRNYRLCLQKVEDSCFRAGNLRHQPSLNRLEFGCFLEHCDCLVSYSFTVSNINFDFNSTFFFLNSQHTLFIFLAYFLLYLQSSAGLAIRMLTEMTVFSSGSRAIPQCCKVIKLEAHS